MRSDRASKIGPVGYSIFIAAGVTKKEVKKIPAFRVRQCGDVP